MDCPLKKSIKLLLTPGWWTAIRAILCCYHVQKLSTSWHFICSCSANRCTADVLSVNMGMWSFVEQAEMLYSEAWLCWVLGCLYEVPCLHLQVVQVDTSSQPERICTQCLHQKGERMASLCVHFWGLTTNSGDDMTWLRWHEVGLWPVCFSGALSGNTLTSIRVVRVTGEAWQAVSYKFIPTSDLIYRGMSVPLWSDQSHSIQYRPQCQEPVLRKVCPCWLGVVCGYYELSFLWLIKRGLLRVHQEAWEKQERCVSGL